MADRQAQNLPGGIGQHAFLIIDPLRNGLSPDPRMPRNSAYADTMQFLRPTPYGAVTPDEITQVSNISPIDWSQTGKPAIFKGERNRWYMSGTQGYSCDGSFTPSAVGATFTAGGVWQGVTFLDIPFFSNGTVFLWGTALSRVTTPTVQALGKHGDRLLLGGLAGAVFSSALFLRIFQQWKNTQKTALAYTAQAWDTGWILYFERRGGSSDRPFDPLLAVLGMYTNDNQSDMEAFVLSTLEQYEWGLCPLRYPGGVQAFHELRDGPVAFGENGAVKMVEQEGLYTDIRIHETGIAGRGAVGGCLDECVFMDLKRELWRIRPGSLPERLNFAHHLADLVLADTTISYDPQEGTYWIADKTHDGFILDRDGKLSGPHPITVSGLAREQGLLVGIVRDTRELMTNGFFDDGTGWTVPAGWTISGGTLNATTTTAAVTKTVTGMTVGVSYKVRYRLVRTSGTMRVKLGTATGSTQNTSGVINHTITCAGDNTLTIEGVSSFTGSVDDFSIVPANRDIVFKSMPLDIGERGTKHLTTLQIARENIITLRGGCDYRYDDASSYAEGPRTDATDAGVVHAYPRISFVDAKAVVTGSVEPGDTGRLERVEFHYQGEDITHKRGTKGIPKES